MERLIDQGILYVAGLLLLAETKGWVRPVLAALLVLIYVAVSNYVESGRVRLVLSAILTVGCCFCRGFCVFCRWSVMTVCGFFWSICAFLYRYGGHRAVCGICAGSWENSVEPQLEWLVFLLVLAGGGAYRMRRHLHQKKAYIHLKDSSTELRLVMQKRQQELMENRIMRFILLHCRSETALRGKSTTMWVICFPVQFCRWEPCRRFIRKNRCMGSCCRSMIRWGRR